jgi:hypothetical protein
MGLYAIYTYCICLCVCVCVYVCMYVCIAVKYFGNFLTVYVYVRFKVLETAVMRIPV